MPIPRSLLAVLFCCGAAWATPVQIVAAENFYGDVARQIGGPAVQVQSILTNPDQDPHLFEASPGVGRAVSSADIVILSGAGYDPWMQGLLGASNRPGRAVIDVAALAGIKPGANPHIWYSPRTMPLLAQELAHALATLDPANKPLFARNLQIFQASLRPIAARVATLRARLAGTPVTATEPVFGYMLQALGMQVQDQGFQLAVMNDTEPSASAVRAMEDELRGHRVKLLVYNAQASDPAATRMRDIAQSAHVPIVAADETEPPRVSYQQWMMMELDSVDRALP